MWQQGLSLGILAMDHKRNISDTPRSFCVVYISMLKDISDRQGYQSISLIYFNIQLIRKHLKVLRNCPATCRNWASIDSVLKKQNHRQPKESKLTSIISPSPTPPSPPMAIPITPPVAMRGSILA